MRGRAVVVAVGIGWIAAAALGSSAWAGPAAPALAVKHGRAIHVTIGGKTEDAFALRAAAGGWRLELGGIGSASANASAGTLVLRDVTLGATGPRLFELPLAAGAIVLDDARFRPDHAYRVELRRGTSIVGRALIYLQPVKHRGPVVFDDGETAPPGGGGDELQTSDKGSL